MAMRRPEPHDPLTRWLDAEREADDAGRRSGALFELFESLPPLAPSAGFANRVLLQIALPAIPAWQSRLAGLFRSTGFRLALASCLMIALPLAVLAAAARGDADRDGDHGTTSCSSG